MLKHSRFAALPKPKETDWELELPEEQLDTASNVELSEEDAAERDRRNNAIREAVERAEFERRTTVMQRSLPRLTTVDIESLFKIASTVADPIEQLIAQEAAQLISNDALKYPIPGAKIHGSSPPVEVFDDEALSRARLEITQELPAEDAEARRKALEDAWEQIHNHSKLPGLPDFDSGEIFEHQVMLETFDVSLTSSTF